MTLIIGFLIGWIAGTQLATMLFDEKYDWYRAVPVYLLFILWCAYVYGGKQ